MATARLRAAARPGAAALLVVGLLIVGLVAAGCTTSSPSSAPIKLTVYGAASLKGVLESVRTAYAVAQPGVALTIATDASSTLRTQIEQGAPADLFLSADESNPAALVEAGLTDGATVDFAGNSLVIIVPNGNPGAVTTASDLARSGVKVIAAGDAVPIARYASQVVANIAATPNAPAGFVARHEANVVSREQNVKAVVAKIELGEGDAAIVYASDARASSKVEIIALPTAVDVRATYSGVVVKSTDDATAAHAFLDWLAGPPGSAVLADFGFVPPSGSGSRASPRPGPASPSASAPPS
ncbi:MAG: molybdate ABC transporter substrate-binding protein [Chloroflexi bacterium]|nr:molybdate ABC transporter substrate-binding protein [Chloroflexota bacterium]